MDDAERFDVRHIPRVGRGYAPTEANRSLVKALKACGTEQATIADFFSISTTTLQKLFRRELEKGAAEVLARIGLTAVQKALAGENDMIRFVLSRKGDWMNTLTLQARLEAHERGEGPKVPPNLILTALEDEEEGPPLIEGVVGEEN